MNDLDEFDVVPPQPKKKSVVCKCCDGEGKEQNGFKQFHLMDADGVYFTSYLTTAKTVVVPRAEEILPPEAFSVAEAGGNLWEQFEPYQALVESWGKLKIPRRTLLSAMSAAYDDFTRKGGRLVHADGPECKLTDPDDTFAPCKCEAVDCECPIFDGKFFDVFKKVDEHGMPLHVTENMDRVLWMQCFLSLTHSEFLKAPKLK